MWLIYSGYWLERIGNTLSINPGRGKDLHAVIIDLDMCGHLIHIEHTVFGVQDIDG